MNGKSMASDTDHFENQEMSLSSYPDSDLDGGVRKDHHPIVAYYKLQRRSFADSGELNDWLSAERERHAADSEGA